MLLHFGAGYHSTYFGTPSLTADGKVVYTDAPYDAQKQLGLKGGLLHKFLPRFASLSDPLLGGMKDFGDTSAGLPNGTQVPTFNATATWVKSNHTYKFGSEFRTEGYTAPNAGNDGTYTFAADQTGQPFQSTPVGGLNVGLPYASFLLGLVKQVSLSGPTSPRQGKKQLGMYAQDSWKVTRRFTLDYGLRWDYSTYLAGGVWARSGFLAYRNPSVGGHSGSGTLRRFWAESMQLQPVTQLSIRVRATVRRRVSNQFQDRVSDRLRYRIQRHSSK